VSGPFLMFCPPRFVFGGTEGVRSRFHVLRNRTHFRRYRGRPVPFSSFALPESFPALSRSSGPVFKFGAPKLVFGSTTEIGSRYQVLCARTRFRQYRGRRLSFSCFARPDSFSAVPRASGPVLMFCAPRLIFGSLEGDVSRFYVLRAGISFLRYGWRLVSFSCFALPGHVFGGTEGVGSRFHVLPTWTRFPRYRGRAVPFSSFARSDSFSAIPRA
jgi:hypothetical protein